MKYLFHSCYKLDPIEIEDNGDVQCFLKEQFRVDTQYISLLYIEIVENISQNVRQYEGDKHITGLSGSKQDENIGTTPLDNREYKIPANEIGGLAAANMHDGAYIYEEKTNHIVGVINARYLVTTDKHVLAMFHSTNTVLCIIFL